MTTLLLLTYKIEEAETRTYLGTWFRGALISKEPVEKLCFEISGCVGTL